MAKIKNNESEVDEEPTHREILWRQYNLLVELFKYYLDLALKVNVFFYAITGGILTFYFANPNEKLVKYSLLLPVIMSLAFGGVFIYGSKLVGYVRTELFQIRSLLEVSTAPDIQILTVSLRLFGVIFIVVAVSMILLILLR